ncbi:MAG: hypothetical protein V4575_10170 [Pseudomonadota bacterium]
MKKFFERFFKKEPEFDYIIAEYQPIKINRMHTEVNVTEYDYCEALESDEMQIDKIYMRN